MWYPATVTTPPSAAAVSLAQAQVQCGQSSDPSGVIARLVATHTGSVEKYCGIYTARQTVAVKCDDFGSFERLPIAPVASVESITYTDVAGDVQTIPSSVYELRADGLISSIVLKFGQSWPATQPGSRIAVSAIAGFETVPPEIVSAILLRVGKAFSTGRADPTLKSRAVTGVGSREWDTSGQLDAATERSVADLLENYRCWNAL